MRTPAMPPPIPIPMSYAQRNVELAAPLRSGGAILTAIAGVLIDCVGYNHMFAIISVANVISIIVYAAWGSRHPSSMTYRIKNGLN